MDAIILIIITIIKDEIAAGAGVSANIYRSKLELFAFEMNPLLISFVQKRFYDIDVKR